MELIIITALLAIIFGLTAVLFFTRSRIATIINKIPGPKGLPIIGNTLDVLISPEALWKLLRKYSVDYYPIYKVWIANWPVVVFRHPDDAEVLLSSQRNLTKSMFYEFLHPWLEEGLLTSSGYKWRERRKILTPAFHFNVLHEFIGAFVDNSERMVRTLKEEQGEVVVDLVSFFAKFTLSAICETAMGTTVRDNDPVQYEYRNAVKQMGDILYYRAVRPWYKNNWIFSLSRKGREQMKALNILHHFTTKIINERKEYHEKTHGKYCGIFPSGEETTSGASIYDSPRNNSSTVKKKRLAMLDLLIAVQKENRNNIDNRGIREEVDTFIFEGHDTTVTGLNFAVALLAEHKEIQARARTEIDAVLSESNGNFGMNELQNLPYLDRCIKEAFRLYPPVPSISRKITDDMQLKNYVVPRGCIVNLYIYDVHRDPNFWPNPEVFDPDRFLPDRIKNRHPFSYIPFSAGSRNCIGQKFAILEMKAFIGLLLHNFILEPVESLSRVTMIPDLVLKSANPLTVKFVPIRR